MKTAFLIYNAGAGKEAIKSKLADIIDIIIKAGYELTIHATQTYRDAYEQVLHMREGYDLLLCSGGDGTIDEVVTGMMRRTEKVPIGYIPTGTTNDFANSLCIPKDLEEATKVAVSGSIFPCDVGLFDKAVFVYVAAFGLFTDVSYQTKREMKHIFGHLAYVLEGAKRLFKIPSYKIKVYYEDQVIVDDFIFGMVTNSTSVGGFSHMNGKRVVFDDGKFEVLLIRKPKNPLELQEIIGDLLLDKVDSSRMYSFSTSNIQFEAEESIPWTLDGEFGGNKKDVLVQIEKQNFLIKVPTNKLNELSEASNSEK